jgi:hypothetical protein
MRRYCDRQAAGFDQDRQLEKAPAGSLRLAFAVQWGRKIWGSRHGSSGPSAGRGLAGARCTVIRALRPCRHGASASNSGMHR